ncbi:hypothetical protein H6G89_20750 [Oscillatoria sp. FACHB-1407]|uniref:hypothetical protein n=1 Tax=Oscillatoria sp. FACHB-1407 TaxID=2692847 RepID=UPI001682A4A4|nr:hypothetical protein [Oscillatoria sp. FACHB-1407]MBD2463442.1 hypothetical protein [Oscillatoria sp. FACHB-1407]
MKLSSLTAISIALVGIGVMTAPAIATEAPSSGVTLDSSTTEPSNSQPFIIRDGATLLPIEGQDWRIERRVVLPIATSSDFADPLTLFAEPVEFAGYTDLTDELSISLQTNEAGSDRRVVAEVRVSF